MRRALGALAACLVATAGVAAAQAQPVPLAPPILVARPPAGAGPATTSRLLDAMIAIARASQANPAAAQNAAFAYAQAIERLKLHDPSGARYEAALATSIANSPAPLNIPTIAPYTPLPPARSIVTGDPGVIDADAFIALARGSLAHCPAAARPQAQHDFDAARSALAHNNVESVRRLATSVIDACATESR